MRVEKASFVDTFVAHLKRSLEGPMARRTVRLRYSSRWVIEFSTGPMLYLCKPKLRCCFKRVVTCKFYVETACCSRPKVIFADSVRRTLKDVGSPSLRLYHSSSPTFCSLPISRFAPASPMSLSLSRRTVSAPSPPFWT